MKLVVTDGATLSGGGVSLDIFSQFGEVQIYDLTAPEQLAERVRDADGILCNKTPFRRNCSTAVRSCGMWANVPPAITTSTLPPQKHTA